MTVTQDDGGGGGLNAIKELGTEEKMLFGTGIWILSAISLVFLVK